VLRLPTLPYAQPETFPHPNTAMAQPNGLLAMGGDLSSARLCAGYRRGIFPWFSEGEPILWWSPDPRMVLVPTEFRASRSLQKSVRHNGWRISFDDAFLPVIHACATTPRAGQHGTWIIASMVNAYTRLHREGVAHSVEVWEGATLVGGLYGVALGRMFFGESMFSHRTDASKAALWTLARRLNDWGWPLIDCQMHTPHLATLGAKTLPRAEFLAAVAGLANEPDQWRRVAP
jgi:leucyl/phenylalanyl-tRNA--protein transferase